ncbi:ABC transporter ATP-binding protein [Jiangella aurantiaca]|uniref:ABC transporter ATP-binding protein n=1 Tax=Jiangella aurantiaca TaxID=2530373 RepID=A0A4R5ABR8_9ACTN|nr:ATP-binding cassette domain-containing protein [Jiangella aurantiaca]TDD69823.1 ABC transporter ATP-binding protein [Jiangella aurantiaca]
MTAPLTAGRRPALTAPLLEVDRLTKVFTTGSRRSGEPVRAVDDVSFDVARGEIFGLLGESGSGKSTLARCLLRLIAPTSGSVRFDGVDVLDLPEAAMRKLRARMQILFQDPYSSLDPRMTVREIVGEPLTAHTATSRRDREQRADDLLTLVGLDPTAGRRRPHAFSGGQRQRIALARALILDPDLVVLDEPVSALDVSVQAQIINLLRETRRRLSLTYVVVLHDLAIARYLCDRVAVMQRGRFVEIGAAADVLESPRHPYTRQLLDALPGRGRREALHGRAPGVAGPIADARGELREVVPDRWVRE